MACWSLHAETYRPVPKASIIKHVSVGVHAGYAANKSGSTPVEAGVDAVADKFRVTADLTDFVRWPVDFKAFLRLATVLLLVTGKD